MKNNKLNQEYNKANKEKIEKIEKNANYYTNRKNITMQRQGVYYKRKPNKKQKRPIVSFRPDAIIENCIKFKKYKKYTITGTMSEFINSSIKLNINMFEHPEFIMKILKKKFPKEWKKINRKRFL